MRFPGDPVLRIPLTDSGWNVALDLNFDFGLYLNIVALLHVGLSLNLALNSELGSNLDLGFLILRFTILCVFWPHERAITLYYRKPGQRFRRRGSPAIVRHLDINGRDNELTVTVDNQNWIILVNGRNISKPGFENSDLFLVFLVFHAIRIRSVLASISGENSLGSLKY